MNPAQKRTWWTLSISLLTLTIGGIITLMSAKGNIDLNDPIINRTVSISAAIPLILIVLLSKVYPGKAYDERDGNIENKSLIWGIMGSFGFMTVVALFCTVQYFKGMITNIKPTNLILFVYFSVFVWNFVSSAVGAVLYYFENSSNNQLQGESK